ncbi:MAG: helix-hairpin-helix domain-containing protein [Candidatus Staskawiczbacteria bacterium]|nr:helix-hairpin-helix domain-containing protein [Candidatus Staskawiczbacteria bacterium]
MKKVLIFIFIFLLSPILILATDKIDINTATLSELDKLTGIGPKYAQAIIDARPFSSVDDLNKVKGIGPKTLQKIKDQGLACIDCKTEITEIQPVANSYPTGVFVNEIMPNPEGADETMEWVVTTIQRTDLVFL